MSAKTIDARICALRRSLALLQDDLLIDGRRAQSEEVARISRQLGAMSSGEAPLKKTQRRVVWMAGRTIPLNERPTRVWAFEDAYDCASPPVVPTKLIDGHNAFEREPEDWNCTNALFTYTPLGEFRPCWLLLEYEG